MVRRFPFIGVGARTLVPWLLAALLCVVVAAPSATAAAPPVSGAIDFHLTLEIGLQSPQANTRVPINVSTPAVGGALNFIEVTSENGVPINVSVYLSSEYSSFDDFANRNHVLVEGVQVTRFMIAFSPLAFETEPSANHTNATVVASQFAARVPNPPQTSYMVVVENRQLAVAVVNYTQDRIGGVGAGAFLPGDFAPATAGALAVCAVAAAWRRRD